MPVSKTMELVVGLFVALGLAAFLMLALKVSDIAALGDGNGYRISARFDNIGSLKVRAPVTLAGVRIGRVSRIDIDRQNYQAVVEMSIDRRYDQLPADTGASILTSGLVGEQYIGLEPGGAEDYLRDGDSIKLTQSALVLERLIGQFLSNLSNNKQ
ncbi:MAG TPA: outer membrane lipid asymmetry maintenance protein MlaD [Candidatus Competibacteraceae bacterium]|nr:outer membrane lipid asymmetry maintenance protein MlaD [Candidatus Competibacteraceae bacterium]